MELWERERLVARIVSGTVRVSIKNKHFLFKSPSREQQYIAQEIFAEHYESAKEEGLYSNDDLIKLLRSQGVWDSEKEELFNTLPKEVDKIKIGLYKTAFKSEERKMLRKALATVRNKYEELHTIRTRYDHLSCHGVALMARMSYLVSSSLFDMAYTPLFPAYDNFLQAPADFIEDAMQMFAKKRITESEYREISRTEPWRSTWSCNKSESSLFGVACVDFTEEQKHLVCWSGLYDSIYQSPECPAEPIIEDDDMLDGWMLVKKKERDARTVKDNTEQLLTNEKIRECSEVYFFAETAEDARNIDALNDDAAKRIKRQRTNFLREKGQVNELDMPDTKKRLMMEATNKINAALQKRGQ